MPLLNVLDGALDFLRQVATGVVKTAADLAAQVVPPLVDGAKDLWKSLFGSGTLLLVVAVAVVAFLMLRRR